LKPPVDLAEARCDVLLFSLQAHRCLLRLSHFAPPSHAGAGGDMNVSSGVETGRRYLRRRDAPSGFYPLTFYHWLVALSLEETAF
jgi:hypothetical protein